LFIRTTPWLNVSGIANSCFLVADALHIRTPTYQLSVYITLVVVIGESKARLLPVYFGRGGESFENWDNAIKQAVPPELRHHIKALVCDGRVSLISVGKSYGWLIQRCQFHLLARLQSVRSVGSQSRHQAEGMALKARIKTVFETTSPLQVASAIQELKGIARSETSRRLKTTLSGLVRNHEHYRTYLTYPELKLAHTTNVVESINSLIRGLMRKMRGFENEESAAAWIIALLKDRRYMNIKSHRKSV
jgi:hypothetical protein